MIDSKLIQLLKTFSTEEWRRFHEFVASPYFNKKKELIAFSSHLKYLAPKFSPKRMEKTKIYSSIFPNKKYDEKHLSYMMNYLLELAEKFIGWNSIEKEKNVLELKALSSFADRKLFKHYQQKYRKTLKNISENETRQQHYYLNQFMLSDIAAHEFESRLVRTFNKHFQEVTQHLDHFYFLEKLKYACGMIDRQQVLSDNYDIYFIEELKSYLKIQKNNPPDIDIYLQVLLMLTEKNASVYFEKLNTLFKSHFKTLPKKNRKEIYFYLINFCLRKIRKGDQDYVSKALEIYQNGIQDESLFENGYLSPWTFTNVVKLALRLQRYNWIKSFIDDNENKMHENFRENALYYNRSELYYYTKDFDKALEYLNQVKFSDLNYHLGSRVILIKIYFETDEEKALTSLIASFTIFLKRNKNISENLRQTYLNFCDLLNQIIRRKVGNKKELKNKIEKTTLLNDRQWLLNVLENQQ